MGFRDLIDVFKAGSRLKEMEQNFTRMFQLAAQQVSQAGQVYFAEVPPPKEHEAFYAKDIEINQLERAIRKQVLIHLSVSPSPPSLPYCLLLMSLVKDVERIGDYAKNLFEVQRFAPPLLPEDELATELQGIRSVVESALSETQSVLESSDRDRAVAMIRDGRKIAHRCDDLVERIARSRHDACTSTVLVLGTRHYKRIGGHTLNILSSIVMPLHKLDFFDEEAISLTAAT